VIVLYVSGLELDRMEGIIPARSRQVISAMVRPVRRVTYQFAISYQLVTPEGLIYIFLTYNFVETLFFMYIHQLRKFVANI
jgi:hypothetical protein